MILPKLTSSSLTKQQTIGYSNTKMKINKNNYTMPLIHPAIYQKMSACIHSSWRDKQGGGLMKHRPHNIKSKSNKQKKKKKKNHFCMN